MSGTFWVFRCKHCGMWSVKELRIAIQESIFKCRRCNRQAKIKQKTEFGLALSHKGPYDNPFTATIMCQALNNKRGKQ